MSKLETPDVADVIGEVIEQEEKADDKQEAGVFDITAPPVMSGPVRQDESTKSETKSISSNKESTGIHTPEKSHDGKAEQPAENDQIEEEEEEEESMEQLVERLVNGEPPEIVAAYMVPSVIPHVQKSRDEHLLDHDVEYCQKADIAIQKLRDYLQREMKLQAQQEITDNYAGRLQESQDNMSRVQSSINRTTRLLKTKHKEELAAMRERHRKEEDTFIEKWQSPQTMRRYNRGSPKLQAMKKQQQQLLAQREYKKLKEYDQQIKALEEHERDEQYRTMMMEYEAQHKLLKNKHKNEMEVLKTAQQGREQMLKAAGDIEMDRAMKRVAAAEMHVDGAANPDKVWQRHYRYERAPVSRSLTSVRMRKPAINQEEITSIKLPPLGDPRRRAKSRTGTVWRAQTLHHVQKQSKQTATSDQ